MHSTHADQQYAKTKSSMLLRVWRCAACSNCVLTGVGYSHLCGVLRASSSPPSHAMRLLIACVCVCVCDLENNTAMLHIFPIVNMYMHMYICVCACKFASIMNNVHSDCDMRCIIDAVLERRKGKAANFLVTIFYFYLLNVQSET